MEERALHDCPKCGQPSPIVPSIIHDHWGWDYSESSHHRGNPDKIVSDRPSNQGAIRV